MRVAVVTGSRAEYGLLAPVMHGIVGSSRLQLRTIVTGMHLSPEFGLTYREIEADGFAIDDRVEMLLSSDTAVGVAKSVGLGVIGFGDSFARVAPDVVLLLGDRFEILAAAQAALLARIPIAHVSGGDVTEGAIDEAIRHSITKMAHLHFVTNEAAARRVRQLGEDPRHIHLVGNPSLDALRSMRFVERQDLESALGLKFRKRNVLVTFHPVTAEERPAAEPFGELLDALGRLGSEVGIVFTRPNADLFGRVLNGMIDAFVAARPQQAVAHTSLGHRLYLSTARLMDAVIGNSSSGLLEIPSLRVASVDIGTRQEGRPRASSVLHCDSESGAIFDAIQAAFALDCRDVENPYGDGNAAPRIVAVLESVADPHALIMKRFHDLEGP